MEENTEFGKFIMEKRKEAGLTQKGLTFLFYPTISLIKGNGSFLSGYYANHFFMYGAAYYGA